ncbi:hypothetical protein Tco_1329192 [Tanacetum coccineum]
MRELREDTFSGNKNEDAHDHIDRVLRIVGLFNIPGVSKDAVMLRVFPFTLTRAVKRWVDRLAPGTINTWDLLKKAFIQRYCPPSKTAKQLEDIYNFTQEGDESLYQAWERYNDLLYKCPTHDINSHQKVNIFYKGLSTMNHQLLDSQGPIPGITSAQALIEIQTMADHSQKWHDGTTSKNIRSNSSNDGLAALFHVGPPGYYTKIDNRLPYGERRQVLEELLAKHQEESVRRSTEMEIEQLTEELHSRNTKSKQANVVIIEHEGPCSPKKLKNLYGISFLSDSQEENTNDQLPMNESNPGHFTLPCTIGNFNFYAMANLGASVNVLPRNVFEYLEFTNLSETEMLVEMADMRKKAPLGIIRDILVKIDKFLFPSDFVKLKKGHLDISKSVRKDLFRLWVIDQFTKALDPDKDPWERCLDEYNWVFHKEIEQLADEYEIKIREKGQVLEEI